MSEPRKITAHVTAMKTFGVYQGDRPGERIIVIEGVLGEDDTRAYLISDDQAGKMADMLTRPLTV